MEYSFNIATEKYLLDIYSIVNTAYKIQNNNIDFSFKCTNRYNSIKDTLHHILSNRMILLQNKNNYDIIGCFYYEILTNNVLTFGPLAINLIYQKQGYGSILLNYIEELTIEKDCNTIRICVVNHRRDVLKMYIKKNYKITNFSDYDKKNEFKKKSWFIILEKTLI